MVGNVPLLPPKGAGLKQPGVIRVYYSPFYKRWIARRWPKSNGGDTPKRKAARTRFVAIVQLIKSAPPEEIVGAQYFTQNTGYLVRDALMAAAAGTLFTYYSSDGTFWAGVNTMSKELQTLLNSLGTNNGALIFYDGVGGQWVEVVPGVDGQILTLVNGQPEWEDNSGGGGPGTGAIDLYKPPPANIFTTIMNGGETTSPPTCTDEKYGMLFDSGPSLTSTSMRCALKDVTGSTWTITAGQRITMGQNNYRGSGLAISDGTKIIWFCVQWNQGTANLRVVYFNSDTSYDNNIWNSTSGMPTEQLYLRIAYSGTTFSYQYSADGRNWVELYSESSTIFLATPTLYGIASLAQAGSTPPAVGDHIYNVVFYWDETSP